jgi:hypothetical protein
MRNLILYIFIIILTVITAGWGQLTVLNSSGEVMMQVDGQANVTIGSATQTGALTTHTLTILNGAADGRVLKSDASGLASWGTDQVDDADHVIGNEHQSLSLSGNELSISDGNSVNLPTGSDNQQLSVSGHTLSLERGGSVTLPDDVNDADHDPSGEIQSLSISNQTISLSQGGGSVDLPPTLYWPSTNISKEPVILDVSSTTHGSLTFSAGVSGYHAAYFTLSGSSDGDDDDYFYLMKTNSSNWQDYHCGGVTLDWDDATLLAPVFEDPAGSGNYKVYWASRDQKTDNLTEIQMYIGLVGFIR